MAAQCSALLQNCNNGCLARATHLARERFGKSSAKNEMIDSSTELAGHDLKKSTLMTEV